MPGQYYIQLRLRQQNGGARFASFYFVFASVHWIENRGGRGGFRDFLFYCVDITNEEANCKRWVASMGCCIWQELGRWVSGGGKHHFANCMLLFRGSISCCVCLLPRSKSKKCDQSPLMSELAIIYHRGSMALYVARRWLHTRYNCLQSHTWTVSVSSLCSHYFRCNSNRYLSESPTRPFHQRMNSIPQATLNRESSIYNT